MRRHPRRRGAGWRLFVRLLIIIPVATVAFVTSAGPVGASFPGDNGRIAFGSDRFGGTHNIFSMNPDGSGVSELTFLTAAQGAALEASWAPDGTKIVFQERNSSASVREIFVMNADGSGQHRLFADPSYQDHFPTYSPDGSRVAFQRCRPDGAACAIYGVRSDGSQLTAITHFDVAHNVLDFHPEYSPDGRAIAFTSFNRGGVIAAVYLAASDGTNVRRLTPPSLEAAWPDWTPNMSGIVFSAHCCTPQHAAIWRERADGTGLTQLTSPGAQYDFAPEYAHDGDHIAFERDTSNFSVFHVLTMNRDGTDLRVIQANAFEPAWGELAEDGAAR